MEARIAHFGHEVRFLIAFAGFIGVLMGFTDAMPIAEANKGWFWLGWIVFLWTPVCVYELLHYPYSLKPRLEVVAVAGSCFANWLFGTWSLTWYVSATMVGTLPLTPTLRVLPNIYIPWEIFFLAMTLSLAYWALVMWYANTHGLDDVQKNLKSSKDVREGERVIIEKTVNV